jgi:hypothetical protein
MVPFAKAVTDPPGRKFLVRVVGGWNEFAGGHGRWVFGGNVQGWARGDLFLYKA